MLSVKLLDRVFIHKEGGQEIELSDPNKNMSPEEVLNFYTPNYPMLVSAKVEGPEIIGDRQQFRFSSVMGTKG